MKRACLVAMASGLAAGIAHGQQTLSSWQGSVNDAWGVAGNWSPGVVPNNNGGSTYAVLIASGSPYLNMSPTIDRIGILPGASLDISNGLALIVNTQLLPTDATGTFSNQGVVRLNSINTYADLVLTGPAGSVLLHGNQPNTPGEIVMSDSPYNRIRGANGVERLHLQAQTLLRGSGQLGANTLEIDNDGIVQSEGAVGLTIDPNAAGLRNRGIIKSEAGPLRLYGGTFTNADAGASIQAVNSHSVTLDACTIVGENLLSTPANGSYFYAVNAPILADVYGGDIRVVNGHALYLVNNLTLCGRLWLDSVNTYASVLLSGDVTIGGACDVKQVVMSNSPYNRIYGANGTERLTLAGSASILGSGAIGLNLMSLTIPAGHVIESEGSTGLWIDPNADGAFNAGQLIAGTQSPLRLTNGVFEQGPGGAVLARADSAVELNAATVRGGQLQRIGNGFVYSVNGSEVESVTNVGELVVPNGHALYVRSLLTNSGVLAINSINTYASVLIRENTAFSGTGQVLMTNSPYNRIYSESGVSTLTLGSGQTLRGGGAVGLNAMSLINNGVIESVHQTPLILDPNSGGVDNNNLLRATPGTTLVLSSGSFDNTDGVIHAQDGGSVTVSAAGVSGGTLTSEGSGVFNLQDSSELRHTTNQGLIGVPNGHTAYVRSSLINNSTLQLNSVNTYCSLLIRENTVLGGAGVISLSNSPYNRIYAENGTDVLTVGPQQVIRGSGSIGLNAMAIINNGLIEATQVTPLVVDPNGAGVDNNALMRAAPGTSLVLSSGYFDNTDGQILAQDGGGVTITAAAISGGSLVSSGTGFFSHQDGSELHNLTSTATIGVPNGHSAYLRGTIINNATLNLNSVNTYCSLLIRGDTTIAGSGQVVLSNSPYNRVHSESGGHTLTIGFAQVVRGGGALGLDAMSILNQGTITADAPTTLVIDPNTGGMTNSGVLQATTGNLAIGSGPFTTFGTVLVEPGRLIHRTADAWVQAGGYVLARGEIQVDSNDYRVQGGVLGGSGRIDSNTVNSGGEVSPGESAGLLTIEGTYTQSSGGALTIQIGGAVPGAEFDVLAVTGAAALDGTINVSLINGFVPGVGQEFDVLTCTTRSGTFSNINAPGFTVQHLSDRVRVTFLAPPCDPDVNCDGSPDQGDVACMILAVAGDTSCICQDPDFNLDGSADQGDIAAVIQVVAGSPCP